MQDQEEVRGKSCRSLPSMILSALFTLTGIGLVAAVIFVCVSYANAKPILLSPPDAAGANVAAMMDAACSGDFDQASQYMIGTPDLGADREAQDAVGALIWAAYLNSMEYELLDNCYATDNGLAQNIRFTCLDISSVTAVLRDRSQTLLEQRVQEAEDVSEIYDENNEYREDFVMEVLYDAARKALAEDAGTVTVELTVNLRYQDGQWLIAADTALMDALFGDILF